MAKLNKKVQHKKANNIVTFNEATAKARDVQLIPKSINQEKYILQLLDDKQDIVIAHGPAGTGKTFLAMQAAIKQLRLGKIERIVLTRPAVAVEEEHGFLPGTLEEKMAPWTRPLLDVMREYYSTYEITKLLETQVVEVSPLAFMRGRTFKNAWIVCDEFQSSSQNQMKMLLTRIGEGSKIVVTGDLEQTDKKFTNGNGLLDLIAKLSKQKVNGISLCQLTASDVQRHRIIGDILKLYND